MLPCLLQHQSPEFSSHWIWVCLPCKIFTACCFKFHPQSTATRYCKWFWKGLWLHSSVPSSQNSPQIVIPTGEVTDETQQISRIFLGTQFLWSSMLSDNFEHVTVYEHRLQLNNRGKSVFTFELWNRILIYTLYMFSSHFNTFKTISLMQLTSLKLNYWKKKS